MPLKMLIVHIKWLIFGIPLFVVMNKEVDVNSFGFIRKKLLETASLLSKIDLVDEYEK